MKNTAIATTSGGYKNVFTQGVLSFFEANNFVANAYASCSSSALGAALASIRKLKDLPYSIWYDGYELTKIEGNSQSNAAFFAIDELLPVIQKEIFSSRSRFLVATSFVKNELAATQTQSDKYRSLGRRLMIDAMKNITDWRDENLELHLFDTQYCDKTKLITRENLKDVLYATTRMLHAWHIPAYINSNPYIDGSYTSMCPVIQLAELGYRKIICITTEDENTKLDLFSNENIPENISGSDILFIKPDFNLKDIGVDYFKTTESGLKKTYEHGIEKGKEFLNLNI